MSYWTMFRLSWIFEVRPQDQVGRLIRELLAAIRPMSSWPLPCRRNRIVYCSAATMQPMWKAECFTPPATPLAGGSVVELLRRMRPLKIWKFFNRPASEMIKTLIYRGGDQ